MTVREKLIETKDKVVEHVKDHKEAYIVGAVGTIAVVGLGVVIYRINKNVSIKLDTMTQMQKRMHNTVRDVTVGGNINAPLIHATYNMSVDNFSPRANPVRRVRDGMVYVNQAAAAIQNGGCPSKMSKHLNGKLADFLGEHFVKIPYNEYVMGSQ